MMYKLLCILKCLTLVATNPLQGLQSCPQVKYVQSYGQPDGPLITSTNYMPYQQQVIVQNEMTPTIQTIPYLPDEQISRLYYKIQPSPMINTFADVNTRAYDQNGIEITRYVSNPATATPNIVNNYIIVPPEYFKFNQSIPNENVYYLYQKQAEKDADVKNNDHTQKEKHNKKKRNENSFDRYEGDNYNNDTPTSGKQSDDVPKNKAKRKESKKNKNKRKSSKKNKNKGEGLESLKGIDENDDVLKTDKQRNQPSKVKPLENDKEVKENKEVKTKRRKTDDGSKVTNKKNKRKKTVKPSQEKSMDAQTKEDLHDDININSSPNENTKKTADVDVCFDINEECADLESRRTRNNCYDRKCNNNNHHHHHHSHNQQTMPRDCPANIASYLNSIISMPNTNYFNPMGNFPYNFNYLYQIPPQSNPKSNESNKKRKKGKKKQKTNNSNTDEKQCTNQNQVDEVTSDDCEKLVELTPQFIEIEQKSEPIITKETPQNIEKIEDETVKDSETKEKVIEHIENSKLKIIELSPKLIEIPSEVIEPSAEIIEPVPEIIKPPTEIVRPPTVYITDDSEENLYVAPEENLYVAPVLDGENIPHFDENDLIDEYYPDFTSDNIYLSKEDYELNNFHDRYYYSSDNRAEMSREKRRYEHVKGKKMRKSNDAYNKPTVKNTKEKKHKDTLKVKDNSSEVKFRIPPPLEFPDFKTEMVNRHRDDSRIEHEHIKYANNNDISKDDDHDNVIETVFAHSKVATYGASPNIKETSSFDLTPTNIDAEKILLSRDGDTTVVIARSLGYPDDY